LWTLITSGVVDGFGAIVLRLGLRTGDRAQGVGKEWKDSK